MRRKPLSLGTFALSLLLAAGGSRALSAQSLPKPFEDLSRTLLAGRDSLIRVTKNQVGLRYRLGATKPGSAFDCSGLVQWVAGLFHTTLPRTAAEQAHAGIEVPKDTAQLLPGDLLVFGRGKRITHIGIYVGDGKFVHAANRRKGVIESDITKAKTSWWKGVRRIFIDADSMLPPPPPFLPPQILDRKS
jgi:hypothetical protein